MKIWWQSVHDFDGDPGAKPYRDNLIAVLNAAAGPGNEVVLHGMRYSNATQLEATKWGHDLHAAMVPKLAMQAEREGYDAFCVGCMTDMGVVYAKEATNIVVGGLCEATMHVATILGEKFSFLSTDNRGYRRMKHLAEEYGLGDRLVPCDNLSLTFHERYAAFDDCTDLVKKLTPIAESAARNGAGVMMLIDNVLNTALRANNVTEIAGVTLLDCSTVLVKTTQMLYELQKMGIKRSSINFPKVKDEIMPWYNMTSYSDYNWKDCNIAPV